MNANKLLLLAATALLAVPFVPNVAAEAVNGPLGPCTGIVDAVCGYSRDPCPPGASCRHDDCIVYLNGYCPITRNEILDLIGFCVIGCDL